MIAFAAIQPGRFWVNAISISANQNYKVMPLGPAGPEGSQALPTVTVSAGLIQLQREDGGIAYQVNLRIQSPSEDRSDESAPYTVDADVSAFILRPDQSELGDEEFKRLVAYNGMAFTYGFARDFVLSTTALGRNGPLCFPALHLASLAEQILASPGVPIPIEERAGSHT